MSTELSIICGNPGRSNFYLSRHLICYNLHNCDGILWIKEETMLRWRILSLLTLVLLLAGCEDGVAEQASGGTGQAGAGIQAHNAWVRAASMGGMAAQAAPGQDQATHGAGMGGMSGSEMSGEGMGNGAAYLLLVNDSSTADRLLRAESDVAKAVELHLSEMKNDIMTMRPVEAIDLPAGGQVELKPGGLHIMLIGLARQLEVGDQVTLTLVFEKAGPLVVQAEVRMP